MKKLIGILCCIALLACLFAFAACDGDTVSNDDGSAAASDDAASSDIQSEAAPPTVGTQEPTEAGSTSAADALRGSLGNLIGAALDGAADIVNEALAGAADKVNSALNDAATNVSEKLAD